MRGDGHAQAWRCGNGVGRTDHVVRSDRAGERENPDGHPRAGASIPVVTSLRRYGRSWEWPGASTGSQGGTTIAYGCIQARLHRKPDMRRSSQDPTAFNAGCGGRGRKGEEFTRPDSVYRGVRARRAGCDGECSTAATRAMAPMRRRAHPYRARSVAARQRWATAIARMSASSPIGPSFLRAAGFTPAPPPRS